jgi:purine nucleosidase
MNHTPEMPRKLRTLALVLLFTLAATTARAFPPEHPAEAVWIDSDAACGTGPRADPDDCLALRMIAANGSKKVVGISSVFGNAALGEVNAVIARLLETWQEEYGAAPKLYAGAGERADCAESPALAGLRQALRDGPITILALGPLTNVGCVLTSEPALASRILELVAVVGARSGHVFHPAEGSRSATLWHGPIFRDFNLQADAAAAITILRAGIPVTLIPYESSRLVSVGDTTLDRLAQQGPMSRVVAESSRPWLHYWKTSMGRQGFFPFDAVAAAYLIAPTLFACGDEVASVEADRRVSGHTFGPTRLIVGPTDWTRTGFTSAVRWCSGFMPGAQPVVAEAMGSRIPLAPPQRPN